MEATVIKVPKPDPVKFLIERKFPNAPKFRSASLLSASEFKHGGPAIKYLEKLWEEIDAYRAELRAKPRDELLALFEEEQEKHRKEMKVKAEQKEQQQFFNLPSADADFEHWSKAPYWTLEEAIALSFGKNPEVVNWNKLNDSPTYLSSPFIGKYKRVRELAVRAKNFKQLYDPILPGLYLAWAKRSNIDLPSELVAQVEARGIIIADWKDSYDKLKERYDLLAKKLEQVLEEYKQIKAANNAEQAMMKSDYWQEFRWKALKMVNEYSDWEKRQRKVQKTGNLQEWIRDTFDVDNREAEILKKVLSDFFPQLK